jgi:hypothetical protein
MANKKIFWVMLVMVMVLAFGMTVVGCGTPEWYYKIQNDSSFRITKIVFAAVSDIKTDTDGLAAGSSKTFFFADSEERPNSVRITVTVDAEDVEVKFSDFGTMSSGEENAKILSLTGTSKDTLQISRKN